MALTRKMLKAMGIEDDKIDQIIESHTDTVEALKDERNTYKEAAERLPGVEKELDDLKKAGDGGWKEKYEKEHSDFESYKNDIAAKQQREAKASAYRALLIEAGIDPKKVDTVVRAERDKVDSLELGDDGKIKNAADFTLAAQKDWADFKVETHTQGIDTPNPPGNGGGTVDLGTLSMEEYIAARKNQK